MEVGLKTIQVDLIFLDLTLPDKEGSEHVENIIKLAANIPVIILTGLNDRQVGIESLKLGGNGLPGNSSRYNCTGK